VQQLIVVERTLRSALSAQLGEWWETCCLIMKRHVGNSRQVACDFSRGKDAIHNDYQNGLDSQEYLTPGRIVICQRV
jgi:hypothetical protein